MPISHSSIRGIIAGASNIKGGDNPPFTVDDFKAMYPQFWQTTIIPADPDANPPTDEQVVSAPYIPDELMQMYVDFANASVKISRFHGAWKMCMALFIAHFLTLYLQTMVNPDFANAQAVAAAGRLQGLTASKSVDGVSVSYDFSAVLQDLDGWAAWKLTAYGVQYATLAKAYGMGGMRVP